MGRKKGRQLMQGNEACFWGAVDAGARFYAGYPITPSSEIGNLASKILPGHQGIYLQMEDEISSLAAVIGASLGGMKGFTATSGPGFSLMQENIGMALMGEIPCVIINAQRVGPSTGAATKPAQGDLTQARWGTHGGLSPIVLAASSVQECYDITVTAFNLAERFSTPVILLTDGVIAHLTEQIVIPNKEELEIVSRARPTKPPEAYKTYEPNHQLVPEFGDFKTKHIVKVTSLIHNEKGLSSGEPAIINSLIKRLDQKIKKYLHELPMGKYYGEAKPDILFMAYGISARSSMEAAKLINEQGRLKAGCCQLVTLWPLKIEEIQNYLAGVKYVVVPEMNLGQLSYDLLGLCKEQQVVPINKYDGTPISPQEIMEQLQEVIKDEQFAI